MGSVDAVDGRGRFVEYLAAVRPHLDKAIITMVNSTRRRSDDANLAASDDARRYLYDPILSFVQAGGKRIRPALCLLGAEAVGGMADDALPAASAIELFQVAALVHDDIADDGQVRRGRPCLHVREGVGLAINAGDLALIDMYGAVLRNLSLDNDTSLAVLLELQTMAERTAEGQALDIGWARDGRWDITIDDYLYMATCKTAYYTAATPLACGAICGGGLQTQVDDLRAFGLLAGLAFQLQDDLLNIVGDEQKQGKDFRSDISEGKRTMIAVHALSHLERDDAAELMRLLSSGSTRSEDLDCAVGLMEQAGSIAYVKRYADDLVARAKDILSSATVTDEATDLLASVVEFFVVRDS